MAGKHFSIPTHSLEQDPLHRNCTEVPGDDFCRVIKRLEETEQHGRVSICRGDAWRAPRPGASLNATWCSAGFGCGGDTGWSVCVAVACAPAVGRAFGAVSLVFVPCLWHSRGTPAAGRAPAALGGQRCPEVPFLQPQRSWSRVC